MDSHDDETRAARPDEAAISLREAVVLVREYRRAITLTILAVAIAFVVGAAVFVLRAPVRRIAELPFRLEFKGAERGEYPNGTKFETSEILSTPVLMKVYRDNGIEEFMPFNQFRAGFFVLESNQALEELTREYRDKLSERLSAVDRERLENEFAEKRASLSKSDYSLVFSVPAGVVHLPRMTQAAVLNAVLREWSEQAVQNKGVVLYDIGILSSAIFEGSLLDQYDYVIALDLLRSRIQRIVNNISDLTEIPGSSVVRTEQGASLPELDVRLQDALNFKVQPLFGIVLSRGLSTDPAASLQFLEARLRSTEMERRAAAQRAEATRRSLEAYVQKDAGAAAGASRDDSTDDRTAVIQLGDSFLDRLLALSSQETDLEYRQELVDELREESLKVVPLEAEAEYYRQIIESFRSVTGRARQPRPEELRMLTERLDSVVQEAILITGQLNQVYAEISRNLNPATVLMSTTQATTFSVAQSVSLTRLALIGMLLLIATVPIAIAGAVVHALAKGRPSRVEPAADVSTAESIHRRATPTA